MQTKTIKIIQTEANSYRKQINFWQHTETHFGILQTHQDTNSQRQGGVGAKGLCWRNKPTGPEVAGRPAVVWGAAGVWGRGSSSSPQDTPIVLSLAGLVTVPPCPAPPHLPLPLALW